MANQPIYTAIERTETPAKIAAMFGLSEEFVRAACARKENPCPAVNVAVKSNKNYWRIHPSKFQMWLDEEERRLA